MPNVQSDKDSERAVREQRFVETSNFVYRFAERLPKLLSPISKEDGLLVDDLDFYTRQWLGLLAHEVVKDSFVLAPTEAQGTLWISSVLLSDLSLRFGSITSYLESLQSVGNANGFIDDLGQKLKAALRRSKHNDFSYLSLEQREDLQDVLEQTEHDMESHRLAGMQRLQEHAKLAAESAMDSASKASTAAGITSDAKLSSFYGSLAESERTYANNFRWVTVFLSLVGTGAALAFVIGARSGVPWLDIQPGDFAHLLQKVIFVAAVFGLAGYFARQAHQHRSMANWAGSLAVQLQTFDAYVAAIENPEVKDDLRKTFGARVFGDHPAMKGEPTVSVPAALADKALDVAAKNMGR